MNVELTPNLIVTNTHPSSRGKPVLVLGNGFRPPEGWPDAFGPSDLIEMHTRSAPAAYWVQHYAKNLTGEDRELVAAYLRQWGEGPQLDG